MKTLILLIALTPAAALFAEDKPDILKDDYLRLATEMEAHLDQHILKKWFPRAVDKERGGFIQDYAEDWTENRDGNKNIVYQARLTWMAAQVALSFPEKAKEYIAYSNHGLDFLADKMWDAKNGGFYWSVDPNGRPTGERDNEKHIYGISFGLYAASTNYKATKNEKAFELAKKTYEWMEAHASLGPNEGYYEALSVKGVPIFSGPQKTDLIGTHYGYFSMNSHIHLLESLTAYYEINPIATVRSRLHKIYDLVHDKIVVSSGEMHMYFNGKFEPVPDLDSFGHDLETAYLLFEASEALDLKPEFSKSAALVAHAFGFGWDMARGGFYNEGSTFRKVYDEEKVWWVQAEGLNALLLMTDPRMSRFANYRALFTRDEIDEQRKRLWVSNTWGWWPAFLKEWEFIKNHQIDAKNGGWISYLNEDGSPARPHMPKSDQWTECYHQGRAVINVIERLRKLANAK